MIRRPISDYWDKEGTRVVHVAWFGGYAPCTDCRALGRRACMWPQWTRTSSHGRRVTSAATSGARKVVLVPGVTWV